MKQIMMKGKQRVKGTVLFTVVSVMMVMVVFLMSTLILTTSANRRSYYTYYQTQAQYAAQSALDCITNFAYSDGDFSSWVQGFADGDYSEHEIYINYTDSNMPLSDINAPNKSIRCTIQREKNPNHVYDTVTQKIHEQPQWKITATAVIGTGRNRTQAQKVTYLYANVQTPKTDDVKNTVNYKRYIYDKTLEETDEYEEDPSSPYTPIANAVYSLSPTGTTDNVVVLGPQYSGMTRIPKGRRNYGGDKPTSADDPNYQKIQNNVASVGDGIFIDNVMMKVNTKFVFQRMDEGLMYYGNLDFANKGTYFDSRIDAELLKKDWPYGKQNYLYVDGVISASGGGVSIGYSASADDGGNKATDKSSRPINVFAGGMNFDAVNNGINICGDLYLYDPDVDSKWIGFKNSTILANFVAKNVDKPAARASYSGTHGNLVCNNKSITIGDNNSSNLTIDGDFLFTNPNGSVSIGSGKLTVGGKAIFACERSKVSGIEKIDCATIVCSDDQGYAAQLQQLLDSGKYGSKTLAEYKTAAGSNNFSLLPFNYRLDEIFDKYYRWDLAGNAGYATDPLVAESVACGHTWATKSFTASVKTGTERVHKEGLTVSQLGEYGVENPYTDSRVSNQRTHPTTYENIFDFDGVVDKYETKTVAVPYTTPLKPANVIMNAYVPIDSSNAASEISKNSNLEISSFTTFKSKMASGAPSITAANKASYGKSVASLNWAYPSGKEATPVGTATTKVYYVNFDCEIDMSAIPAGEILFIDPTTAASKPLRVAIKGDITNRVILINNTAKYTWNGTDDPQISYNYTEKDGDSYTYFDREEVYLFLESGLKCEKALILTTGVAGGFIAAGGTIANNSFDTLAKKKSPELQLVSNPLYPGQAGWSSLSKVEKTKFMYVPNDVIFGQEKATYTFTNGGMMTGAVMMPYSTVEQKTQAPSPKITYREDHSSIAVDPGDDRSLACVGSLVVGKFVGDNWSMVAYLGDGNRTGGRIKKTKETVKNTRDNNTTSLDDPAFDKQGDKFTNDHQGLN